MKLEHFLIPYTKINSKWIKYLNARPENIKLSEENISRPLSDINHSKIFFDPPPRVMKIKTKINKLHLIKFISFLLLAPHICYHCSILENSKTVYSDLSIFHFFTYSFWSIMYFNVFKYQIFTEDFENYS